MITVRYADERGSFDHRWLQTSHTFSFGEYQDPEHMGFGPLRVINDDVVAPGRGFAEHAHRDMEILTYVLSGTLRHRDSLGHEEDIIPGMVQRMTAGSGIRHAEVNPSHKEPVHLLQVWVLPERKGLTPEHESRTFRVHEELGRLHTLASPDGRDGSLAIHQDVAMLAGVLRSGDAASLALAPGRRAWVHVAKGALTLNGVPLSTGDGAGVSEETELRLASERGGEVLVFDVA